MQIHACRAGDWSEQAPEEEQQPQRAHLPLDGVERIKADVHKDAALGQEGERLERAHRGRALLARYVVHRVVAHRHRAAEQRHDPAQAQRVPRQVAEVGHHAYDAHRLRRAL